MAVALVDGVEHDAGVVDRGLLVRDVSDAQAEEVVDRRHPTGTGLREVVVRRDEVRALTEQRVQVQGRGGNERLALASLHLRDVAFVQRHRAHELDIEVALADGPLRRLANRGERLGQDVVERLAFREPVAEIRGTRAKPVVRESLGPGFERVDLLDDLPQSSELTLVGIEDPG